MNPVVCIRKTQRNLATNDEAVVEFITRNQALLEETCRRASCSKLLRFTPGKQGRVLKVVSLSAGLWLTDLEQPLEPLMIFVKF